jgi:hypothetical protein
MLKTLLIKNNCGKKIEMMITYHPHMKNTPNLKIVVLESFRNSKYNLKMFKCQRSFTTCKWVMMSMTFEQSSGL